LQVSRAVIRGGFDYHVEIARSFVESGAEVCTVFQRGRMPEGTRKAFPGRVICLDAANRRAYKQPLWLALALWKATRGRRQDLTICHHLTPARAVQKLLRLGLVRKAALVVHDYDYFDRSDRHGRRRNRFLVRALRCPWRIVGVSQAICRNVQEQVSSLPPHLCQVIHNAIDTHALEGRQLSRADARRVLGLEAEDFVFGTVGRLVGFKAHDDLIDAFARAYRSMPRARLIIIGRGPLEALLRQQVGAAGLEGRVRFQGFVDDAARYMKAFDVFVLPSRHEPFGLVLLEAMVSRLPIIASDNGAPAEILPPTSALFPTGDRKMLAERLLQAYQTTPPALERMGLDGYQHVGERFALQDYRAAYAGLLEPANGRA
jgi:glycosyltransferase involved in cell wall biosynthesis